MKKANQEREKGRERQSERKSERERERGEREEIVASLYTGGTNPRFKKERRVGGIILDKSLSSFRAMDFSLASVKGKEGMEERERTRGR